MGYDPNKPANDAFLADFPPLFREQLRAVVEDMVVNAMKVGGYMPGNSSGNIPVSNGVISQGLNADMLDGKNATDFASNTHNHDRATTSSDGYMSNTDKQKLDKIAYGAEVNQNAISNIKIGEVVIQSDNATDTLEIVAGKNIKLEPDATNDKFTISVSGKVDDAGHADAATTAGSARYLTNEQNGDSYSIYLDCVQNGQGRLVIEVGDDGIQPIVLQNRAWDGNLVEYARFDTTGGKILGKQIATTDKVVLYNATTGLAKVETLYGYGEFGAMNPHNFHYITDRAGHWFNRDLRVQGDLYGGEKYDRRAAYIDEVPKNGNQIIATRMNAETDIGTAREIRWRMYGSGHTIVDNSSGEYPGTNENAQIGWEKSYPILVGYDGVSTFGVRVDSARIADTAKTLGGFTADQLRSNVAKMPNYAAATQITNLNFTAAVDGMISVYAECDSSRYISCAINGVEMIRIGAHDGTFVKMRQWAPMSKGDAIAVTYNDANYVSATFIPLK